MKRNRIALRYRILGWLAVLAIAAITLLTGFLALSLKLTGVSPRQLAEWDSEFPVDPAALREPAVPLSESAKKTFADAMSHRPVSEARYIDAFWERIAARNPEAAADPRFDAWRKLDSMLTGSRSYPSDRYWSIGRQLNNKEPGAAETLSNYRAELLGFRAKHPDGIEVLDVLLAGGPLPWPARTAEDALEAHIDQGSQRLHPREIKALALTLVLADAVAAKEDGRAIALDLARIARIDARWGCEAGFPSSWIVPTGGETIHYAAEAVGQPCIGLFALRQIDSSDAQAYLDRVGDPATEEPDAAHRNVLLAFHADRRAAALVREDFWRFVSDDGERRRAAGAPIDFEDDSLWSQSKRTIWRLSLPLNYPFSRSHRIHELTEAQRDFEATYAADPVEMKEFMERWKKHPRSSIINYRSMARNFKGIRERNDRRLLLHAVLTARAGQADLDEGKARLGTFNEKWAGGRLAAEPTSAGMVLTLGAETVALPPIKNQAREL